MSRDDVQRNVAALAVVQSEVESPAPAAEQPGTARQMADGPASCLVSGGGGI